MELSELSKMQVPEGPQKGTSRTIKPADRCVISYNFEQTNSNNYTHNLLIGMFNENTRKIPTKHHLGPSRQLSSHKLAAVAPQPKKIKRQEPTNIFKVYENNLFPSKYPVAWTPKKPRNDDMNYHHSSDNYENADPRLSIDQDKNRHRSSGDRALQQNENERSPQRQPFNEDRERRASPYRTKGKQRSKLKIKINSIDDEAKQNRKPGESSRGSHKKSRSNDSLPSKQGSDNIISDEKGTRSFDRNREKKNQSLYSVKSAKSSQGSQNHQSSSKGFINTLAKKGVNSTSSKGNHDFSYQTQGAIHDKTRTHLKKVTENENEFAYKTSRASPSKYSNKSPQKEHNKSRQGGPTQALNTSFGNPLTQEHAKQTLIERKSRKQIQDQQLRQIQEIIKKEESHQLKKGYHKALGSPKEFFPFNADIEPIMHISKRKGKAEAPSNKTTLYRETRKNQEKEQKNNLGRPLNTRKIHQRKQPSVARQASKPSQNKQMTIGNATSEHKLASNHQNRQHDRSNQSMNNFNKLASPNARVRQQSNHVEFNKNKTFQQTRQGSIARANDTSKGSFNIKRNQLKKKTNESVQPQQEDITQDNKIKGFKVPQKQLQRNNVSVSMLKEASQNKIQAQSHIRTSKQTTIKETPNKNQLALPSKQLNGQRGTSGVSDVNISQRNSQMKVGGNKLATPHRQHQSSMSQHQNNAKIQKGQQSPRNMNNNPNQPTFPRQPSERTRKFKNWREADPQTRRQSMQRKTTLSRVSNESRDRSISQGRSERGSRRNSKEPQQIDLDAEQQDRFGLLAQKNVTTHQRKNTRKSSQFMLQKMKKMKQKNQNEEYQIDEEDQKSHKSQNNSVDQKSESGKSKNSNNEDTLVPESHKIALMNGDIPLTSQNDPRETPIFGGQMRKSSVVPKIGNEKSGKQGTQEIDHLMQENGSKISSIDENDAQMIEQRKQTVCQSHREDKEQSKSVMSKSGPKSDRNQVGIIPGGQSESNLQELLRATEQVPNQKNLEPILNNVEVQLGKSPSTQQIQAPDTENPRVDQGDMAVNLPVPSLQLSQKDDKIGANTSPRVNIPFENETDCNQELMDNIAEIPLPEASHHNKSLQFFQCNLKQTSKLSDLNQTINVTRYEPVDKDTTNYTRAPVLSFLYEVKGAIFTPSTNPHLLLMKLKTVSELNDLIVDQAINILLSIDPWIIQRVFEPFEDKEGNIGVWLYCHGEWRLYLQKKNLNFRVILANAAREAVKSIGQELQMESVIKVISGVRVMRLKSSKKKIFNELEYSLKKGHVIKAYTAKESKWGQKLLEVGKVESTKQGENVLQIKQDNDTYWIKESKFKEVFEHFLLICTRHVHYWTNRELEQLQSQKTVLTLTSLTPSHGSLTLYYPSSEPSSLLLYKQLDSKVLKYMGKIQQKPNHNGNLYFQFKLHGSYSLFLQTPTNCRLAIESTNPLQIGMPEHVIRDTLRNNQCEYVQLNQTVRRSREGGLRGSDTLERLKEKFISMVVKK